MTSNHVAIRNPRALQRAGISFWPVPEADSPLANPNTLFEKFSQHPRGALMPLGAYSYSHSHFRIEIIGRYCSIGENLRIMGNAHPVDWVTTSPLTYRARRRARWQIRQPKDHVLSFDDRPARSQIGHDVWIGQDVLLRSGISIGTGAVIGAGSVVTRDVQPYQIVAGNPARPIRPRFEPGLAQAMLDSQWWMYDPDDLIDLPFDNPTAFLDAFMKRDDLTEKPLDYRPLSYHLKASGEPDAVATAQSKGSIE